MVMEEKNRVKSEFLAKINYIQKMSNATLFLAIYIKTFNNNLSINPCLVREEMNYENIKIFDSRV